MSVPRRLDVVVIGGGPAGLAAADAAAACGRSVLLIDQAPRTGGQIWRHRPGDRLPAVAQRLLGAAAPPRVSVANRAAVIDAPSPHELVVSFQGRIAVVETAAVIIATGAVERLLPFPGWTLPGVLGVGGLQALVKSGLRVSGARVVLAGTGPLLLPVAATVRQAGAHLALVAEQAAGDAVRRFAWRALRDPSRLAQAMRYRLRTVGVGYPDDSWVVRAEGDTRLRRVTLSVRGEERTVDCDWLGAAAGLVPRTDIGELLGCAIEGGAIAVDRHQATSVPDVWAVGECCGVTGDLGARLEGEIAGLRAGGVTQIAARLLARRDRERRFGALLDATFAPRAELLARVTPETIICRCEDVARAAIDPAWSQRQAKLWTRVGMGNCQGAVCGAACEGLFGWRRNAARPPLERPAIGAWAAAMEAVSSSDRGARRPPVPPGA